MFIPNKLLACKIFQSQYCKVDLIDIKLSRDLIGIDNGQLFIQNDKEQSKLARNLLNGTMKIMNLL